MSAPASESGFSGFSPSLDEDLPRGSVSGLAVVGLALGLSSLSAVFSYPLWCLPPLAFVVNVLALRRIDRYWPGLVGRPIALVGLALAIVGGVAAPAHQLTRNLLLTVEANRIADLFFELLRDDKPEQAYQLTLERTGRLPFGGALWARYRASGERMDSLREFANEPVVRALLELGPQAQLRLFEEEERRRLDDQEVVVRAYAVTYPDEAGKPRSFFIRLVLVHKRDVNGDFAWWVRVIGPIRPENWEIAPAA